MNLTDQLLEFYHRETWHETRLPDSDVKNAFEVLFKKGRIITCIQDGKLLGYGEVWRINFEQFGRIICHVPFHVAEEDIETGNIAYIANVHILEEYRRLGVLENLKNQFMLSHINCDYFVGEALRKKHQPVKVFKRTEIL